MRLHIVNNRVVRRKKNKPNRTNTFEARSEAILGGRLVLLGGLWFYIASAQHQYRRRRNGKARQEIVSLSH